MATTDFTGGVTLSDAGWADDVDCSAYSVLSGVAGTNTITGTGPATYSYAATRTPIWLVPAATNTGATTINVTPSGASALGAKNVFWNGVACVGGELRIGVPAAVIYDGTQFHIIANGFSPRQLTLGTAQASTSGTSIDFTGIPSWAKKIIIQFVGVSTSGTSDPIVQIGDAGGVETSGYLGVISEITGTSNVTDGFGILNATAGTVIWHGSMTLTLEDSAGFTWVASANVARSDAAAMNVSAGSKSLSAALDRVRITTSGGADTFDAGAINILYE